MVFFEDGGDIILACAIIGLFLWWKFWRHYHPKKPVLSPKVRKRLRREKLEDQLGLPHLGTWHEVFDRMRRR